MRIGGHFLAFLALLAPLAAALAPPQYPGLSILWQDDFAGDAGTLPDGAGWNVVTGDLDVNGELQTYTADARNLQRSGGATLQLVPWRDGSTPGGWTSGRVESRYVFTPAAGRTTAVEARIRFGTSAPTAKKGLWPAFWMLGDRVHSGTPWPQCGEIDIGETINGALTGYGTAHCDVDSGGLCNEPNGRGGSTPLPNQDWHDWRLEIARGPGDNSNWQAESLTWLLDGRQFFQLTGAAIGNPDVWATLAHSPFFFILNVAVGGDWPGPPDGSTLDGYGSMMEVGYVALYQST